MSRLSNAASFDLNRFESELHQRINQQLSQQQQQEQQELQQSSVSHSNPSNQPTIDELRRQRADLMAARLHGPTAAATNMNTMNTHTSSSKKSPPSSTVPSGPVTLASASAALSAVGGLKTYKPDGVLNVMSGGVDTMVRQMSLEALENLLQRQRSTLQNKKLCDALPDKGMLISQKIVEIEAAMKKKKKFQQQQIEQVEKMMEQVKISREDQNGKEMEMSNSNLPSSTASSQPSTFTSQPRTSIRGRGSAAIADSCSAEQINARIAADVARNIESPFRRAPPQVISSAEATSLIRAKDADWQAMIASNPIQAFEGARNIEDQPYREQELFDDDDLGDEDRPGTEIFSEGEEDFTSDVE